MNTFMNRPMFTMWWFIIWSFVSPFNQNPPLNIPGYTPAPIGGQHLPAHHGHRG